MAKKSVCFGVSFEGDIYGNESIGYARFDQNFDKKLSLARAQCDYLILSCHWGVEFLEYPTPYVVQVAHAFADLGADLIIGHHPHCLQGFEKYKDTLIFYSLGNFLFDMCWDKMLTSSGILIIDLKSPDDFMVVPVFLDKRGFPVKAVEDNYMRLFEKNPLRYFTGDFDHDCVDYFARYLSTYRRLRLKSYGYFLRNYFHLNRDLRMQVLERSFLEKLESFQCLVENSMFTLKIK